MITTQQNHIVLYTNDRVGDQLLINVLNEHYKRILVVNRVEDISGQLLDEVPKVIMVAAETFQETLSIYYKALDGVTDGKACEHFIVSLISRHDENEAYEAFSSGVIDDYLVARPLYEIHRPVVICTHLLKELGISFDRKEGLAFIHKKDNYADEVKEIVARGLERKEMLRKDFEQSLLAIDKALDNATEQMLKQQTASLDISMLQKTLASIRSDEIRPELLKLQNKALNLLQQMVSDVAQDDSLPEINAEESSASTQSLNKLHNTTGGSAELHDEKTVRIPRLLVVEDDPISVHLTTKLLNSFKIELETAYSGRRAFACLTSRQYDLILLDINLPDTNGLYLLNQVCSGETLNKDTPIIMLTGNKNKNIVKKAIEVGAKGYILKPLYKDSVIKLFQKYDIPMYANKQS